MTTDTREPTHEIETTFTAEEARTIETLRLRCQADHDLFSQRELAHLRFLRWRIASGRLRTTAGRAGARGPAGDHEITG